MSAGVALAVISALTGALAMLIFRALSSQARIRATRNAITAHVLEMRIYQDDLALILRALGAALATHLRYLRLVLVPVLGIAIVMALVFIQLDARFSRAPLRPGESAMVTATLRSGTDVMSAPIELEAGDGAAVHGPRVRVFARREVNWQVCAERAGAPRLTLRFGNVRYELRLAAQPGAGIVGRHRSQAPFEALWQPGLPPLPPEIDRVEVRYPPARHSLLGWETHWLIVFAFWSLAGALALKLWLRVEI
jgi:hypothetical protein